MNTTPNAINSKIEMCVPMFLVFVVCCFVLWDSSVRILILIQRSVRKRSVHILKILCDILMDFPFQNICSKMFRQLYNLISLISVPVIH